MGVFDFEENRLRQKEIEVKALWDYGFPDKLAEDINQETL